MWAIHLNYLSNLLLIVNFSLLLAFGFAPLFAIPHHCFVKVWDLKWLLQAFWNFKVSLYFSFVCLFFHFVLFDCVCLFVLISFLCVGDMKFFCFAYIVLYTNHFNKFVVCCLQDCVFFHTSYFAHYIFFGYDEKMRKKMNQVQMRTNNNWKCKWNLFQWPKYGGKSFGRVIK